jgi:hypothetical protein
VFYLLRILQRHRIENHRSKNFFVFIGDGMVALKVGDIAPDFELQAVTGDMPHKFRLSDYRGKKNVVLAFYPADWTPT